jgi:hypothetical protein
MWSQIKLASFVMISVAGLLVALNTDSLLLAELSKGLSIVCLLLAMKTMVEAGVAEKN